MDTTKSKSAADEVTEELLPSGVRDSFEIEDVLPSASDFHIDRKFALTLFVIWTGNFLCSVDGTIVSTTMSNIASEFGQSDMVSWIATSYLLTSTAFQPLYGKTSDILGRKTLLLFAQCVFTLGTLLSALATNVETLSIARAVSGMGGAGIYALASIIITDVVPLSKRSIFVGYGTIIGSTAQMLGAPLGGICIVTIGWRWMFLIQVPFLLVCIVLLAWKVEVRVEHIPEGEERFSRENLQRIDIGGIVTLNLAVSSIIFLFAENESSSMAYRVCFSMLLVLSTIGYFLIEKYVAVEKIIDPELVKGQIGVVGFTSGISSLGLYMVLFITPVYLQQVQGVSVTRIGIYTTFFVISTAIGSLVAGYIIRKHDKSDAHTIVGSVNTSTVFFAFQTFGFAILTLLVSLVEPETKGLAWRVVYVFGLVLAGFGSGGYNVGTVIFIIGKVGKRVQASANTLCSLIRQLGSVIGVSLSLSSYSRSVAYGLRRFFKGPDEHYVDKLVGDSTFLKDGLPEKYVKDVLQIYKRAIASTFIPSFALIVIGLVVMLFLNRRVAHAHAHQL